MHQKSLWNWFCIITFAETTGNNIHDGIPIGLG